MGVMLENSMVILWIKAKKGKKKGRAMPILLF